MPTTPEGRRPLKSRDQPIFKHFAAWLAGAGVSPNAISFTSIVFGAGAGLCFAATACTTGGAQRLAWLGAAVCIQLRLIANLLDGMVAVEGRRGGPTGDLWNEAPDRVADAFIFIGVGYAAGGSPLHGYAAALLAVFVAYVRALGASVGAGQIFIGPMAKPHRMFVLTLLALAGAILPGPIAAPLFDDAPVTVVRLVLALIILGCVVTAFRRLSRIAAFLRTKAS
jgi:phosphatidylglycerophosphate synthase